MTKSIDELTLTDPAPNGAPSVLSRWMKNGPKAGVYNDGLVTFLAEPGLKLPEAWSFLPIAKDAVIYCHTCVGNFFVADSAGCNSYSIYVQGLSVVQSHRAPEGAVNFALVDVPDDEDYEDALDGEIVDTAINRVKFELFLPQLGTLKYDQCYTMQPLAILGGDMDDPNCYGVGDFATYIEIASQTLHNNPLAEPEILS